MSENLKVLQVFIASPNDLVDERRAIKEVADELNAILVREVGLQIQLLGWEDRLPGFGRAQAQINEDVDKADLFVGFLWRRWGSDSGNAQYTSGFEEEFNRAVERRKQSSVPEISLFFKDVKIQSQRDVDDQLRKVLEFRNGDTSKKLLFGTFTDIEDWKNQTRELLHCHLLKLLKSTMETRSKEQPQAPLPASTEESGKAATGQKDKNSTSAAKQQIVRIWGDVLEAIKQDELSQFSNSTSLDKLKIARIGLAVAGITNRDIGAEMPGVHLTNVLFKHRKKVELTQLEWLLIFRANLISKLGYHPGWYWLRKPTINVKGALVYLACHDEHASVRNAAIAYASELGVLLPGASRKKQRPIEVLCSHSDADTRKAALKCLTEKGSTNDLPLLEKLRIDPDGDVRTEAETARNSILLRDDASQFFENYILTNPRVSNDGLAAIQRHAAKIETEVLRKALTHPDTKVQVFAAKELAVSVLIPLEEIRKLKDNEGICEVFWIYFLNAISAGQMFTSKEIRDALEPIGLAISLLSDHKQVDTNRVINELFKHYTYEELVSIADLKSDDAPIAYRILAEQHFNKFGDKVRADLKSNFAALRMKTEPQEGFSLGSLSLSYLVGFGVKPKPDISSSRPRHWRL